MPDYYPLFVAADRCHCTPWQMAEVSVIWRDWALKISTAENQARAYFAQHG